MSELEHILLSKLLGWYELQRHDFLNELQVILGNLQLNQMEKTQDYIKEIISWQREEQKIASLREPVLAVILLELLEGFRQVGIRATIAFPEVMKLENYWRECWREEYALGLYGYTQGCLTVFKVEEAKKTTAMCQGFDEELEMGTAEIYLFEELGGFMAQVIVEDDVDVLLDRKVKFTPGQTAGVIS